MPKDTPTKVHPSLLQHITFVQSELKAQRDACETRPRDCQMRDSTPYAGQFNPVHLWCDVCEIETVLFKREE